MTTWFIGECNPYGRDQRYALFPHPRNSTGWRLCHLVLGLERARYMQVFERRNLLPDPRWSNKRARAAAAAVLEEAGPHDTLVLLGVRVARAFGIVQAPFSVHLVPGGGGRVAALIPHPSGLCRLWNEPGAYERAREAVRLAERTNMPMMTVTRDD